MPLSSAHPDLLIPSVLLNETCSECSADTSANESLACTELQGLAWGVDVALGLYTIRLSRPHSAGVWMG